MYRIALLRGLFENIFPLAGNQRFGLSSSQKAVEAGEVGETEETGFHQFLIPNFQSIPYSQNWLCHIAIIGY